MPSVTGNPDSRTSNKAKIPKSSAGYIYRPETEYRCGECVMLKPVGKSNCCAWFGAGQTISATAGSCIYFAHSAAGHAPIPWLGLFTKIELGYAESAQGFSCKRCEYFDVAGDCRKVDRDSEGDTPGEIAANACCGLWEADKRRAKMTREALLKEMGKS